MVELYELNKKYLPIFNKRNPQSLKICLDDFKKSWKDFDRLSRLNEDWSKLTGLELSKKCKPLKIEQKILTIAVNHPQWRQALIYNKHKLKETIINKLGIDIVEIKITQNYEVNIPIKKETNTKLVWEQHPSRVKKNNMTICKLCNCPSPKGEISRWGKCTFCWRKND